MILSLTEQYCDLTIQLVDLSTQLPSHLSVNTHSPMPACKIQTAYIQYKAPGFLLSVGEGNTGNLLRSFTVSLTAQSGTLVRGRLGLASMPL